MSSPDVQAVLVAYRSGPQLGTAIGSLLASADARMAITVVNNAPGDPEPLDVVRGTPVRLVQAASNIGFCAAVNLGLADATAPYVLLLNPDATVAPDYVARLVARAERDPGVASFAGRILLPDFDGRLVDSLGLGFRAGRRAIDLGHGLLDDGTRQGVDEVFGVTAAAALYRRSALLDVAVDGAVLPPAFFMYLDDVDLAWRLRLAGYRAVVDHSAVAVHSRAAAHGVTGPGRGAQYLTQVMRRHAERPDYVRTLSLSNHVLMLIRNDDPETLFRDFAPYMFSRLAVEAFTAVQRPGVTLAARRRLLRLVPDAVRERGLIQSRRVATVRQMAHWLR